MDYQNHDQLKSPAGTTSNTLAVYTVLKTLRKMKQELGLEAMLQYADRYAGNLELHNPRLKYAVAVALEFVDVKKTYSKSLENDL